MKRYIKSADAYGQYYGKGGRPIHFVRIDKSYGERDPRYEVWYKLDGISQYKGQRFQRYTKKNVPKKVLDFLSKAKYYSKYAAWYLPEDFVEEGSLYEQQGISSDQAGLDSKE